MNVSSAGILPMSKNDAGEVVFLVGKDSRDCVFSDFGGKYEHVDNGDPINTATREFYEETLGSICNTPYDIRFRVKHLSVMLEGETKNKHMYRMYVLEIPYYRDVPQRFKKIMNFLKYRHVGSTLVEKSEIAWVTLDELMKIPKRRVFHETLLSNLDILQRMTCEPWGTLCREFQNRPATRSVEKICFDDGKYHPPHHRSSENNL
jgi:hypothetical protein